MTRTQLRAMTDRELVEYARRFDIDLLQREYFTLAKVLEALTNRLDDRYPFNPEPTP